MSLFGLVFTSTGSLCFYALLRGLFQPGGVPPFGIAMILLIGGGHLGIGLIILSGVVRTVVDGRAAARLERAHPGKPWLHREDWARGRIHDSYPWPIALFGMTIMAGFGLLVGPVVLALGWRDGRAWGIVCGLLLVPLGFLARREAFRTVHRRLKFGRAVLELRTVPVEPGGILRGTIHVPRGLQPGDGLTLTLACKHTYRFGKGTATDTLWTSPPVISPVAAAGPGSGVEALAELPVPAGARPSAPPDEGWIDWELEARARVPGVELAAEFQVPVYETELTGVTRFF